MQSSFGKPFDPFQAARPDSAPDKSTDPVLPLFARWQVASKAAIEAGCDIAEAESAFLKQYGDQVYIGRSQVEGWMSGDLYAPLREKIIGAVEEAHEAREALYRAELGSRQQIHEEHERAEEALLQAIKATPSASRLGIAAKLEVALSYSDYDPESEIDPLDLPWSLILAAIKELKAGVAS